MYEIDVDLGNKMTHLFSPKRRPLVGKVLIIYLLKNKIKVV